LGIKRYTLDTVGEAKVDFLSFLNDNAPAIQAVAAVFSFVVTLILAIITWKYVQLTRTIAAATKSSLDLNAETRRARERQLDGLVTMVEQRLAMLPTDLQDAESIRGASTWGDGELFDLHQLAAEEGHDPGAAAAELIGRLRWLQEQIVTVKSTPREKGVDWPRFPWHRWREELSKARSEIPRIRLDLMNVRKGYKLR
jgi:hypothetical protein